MQDKKILIISTQLRGGCFQYANSILKCWPGRCEIVLPKTGREDEDVVADWSIRYVGYGKVIKIFSFIYSLLRISFGLLLGKYNALVLFGITKWDYYYLKLWNYSKYNSFTVIHDGKMHEGDVCEKIQKRIVEIMTMSTHLVFLSEYVKNLVKDNFNIDKPFHVAPHGLIEYGSIQQNAQRTRPNILFFGRVAKYKGIDTLLDAMHYVPVESYSKLIIAGKWSDNMNVISSTDKLKIVNKFLSKEEILHYIEICDIMVFPYHEATQSGVATLALNYLKPSIVTDVGALKEQFTNSSAIFVPPYDSVLFAKAITELCVDVNRRNLMIESIVQEKKKLDWSQISIDLYNYIISELNDESTNR